MTKQERYAEALKSRGFTEIKGATTKKYRLLRSPDGTNYYLGKSGAVRFGRTVSTSVAMSDVWKAQLLA